ncbi:MAG: Lipoprotein-releasing system permease protein [candidate division TM6 bacterium GW2011_GWF2_32_72]|nr:MAG: Lipoprotein-releasing system permease protein [candidate division TM6 bacterium GW2011_GWF2_32_72]
MIYINFLIAWRYLFGIKGSKNISIMAKVCFLGIFIGSFALALTMCVMNGFEKATHKKLQGIHSQIIAHANGEKLNFEAIENEIKEHFPEIDAVAPSEEKQAIIQQKDSDEINEIISIKAISAEHEPKLSELEQKITLPANFTIKKALQDNRILIGHKLAKSLDLSPGNELELLFAEEGQQNRKITLSKHDVTVGAIFDTGIEEFDANVIFCSMDLIQELFPDSGVTQIGIKLKRGVNEKETIKKLKDSLELEVYSWKDLYPALVSALQLEKYAMFLILILIILVASMNVISLLFMQITQKKSDIAILRSMGLSSKNISFIFVFIGLLVAFFASLTGTITAAIASWFLETYPFIQLPDIYYVTHLPAQAEWYIFIIVFLVVMLLSFISSWIPAKLIQKLNISEILRFEA